MIEPLESRIAPAILFHYTDVDGDKVTISVSKGAPSDAASIFSFTDAGPFAGTADVPKSQQLTSIHLNGNAVFKGANISVTAKPQDANGDGFLDGDGLVNVGHIDIKTGGPSQLGSVFIQGDLGRINGGSVQSLSVFSLGRFGTATGAPNLTSGLRGDPVLKVHGDVLGSLEVDSLSSVTIGDSLLGALTGHVSIGSIKIGGDLAGTITGADLGGVPADVGIRSIIVGGAFTAGEIHSYQSIGSINIHGDMRGAASGDVKIVSAGSLRSVTIGGSLIGGLADSGSVFASGTISSAKIGGDIRGGSGANSGSVSTDAGIGNLQVRGSIIGGTGDTSGVVLAPDGPIQTLKIGGDLRGGSAANLGDPTPTHSGYVSAYGLGSVTVAGSVISGFGYTGGSADAHNGSIRSGLALGSLTVKGSLIGNAIGDNNRVIISAVSQHNAGTVATSDHTIGKITIGGRVEQADILAGYRVDLVAANPDAQIGSVTVTGDWLASNLIAGVQANGNGFANSNDGKIAAVAYLDNDDAAGAISKIASVTIKGSAIGTISSADTAVFGIEAQQISRIKVGGAVEPLQTGKSNDVFNLRDPLGATFASDGSGDFRAFEV